MLKIFLLVLQLLFPHLKKYVLKNGTLSDWIKNNFAELIWMSAVIVMFASVLWMVDLNISLYDRNRKLEQELRKVQAEAFSSRCKETYTQPPFFVAREHRSNPDVPVEEQFQVLLSKHRDNLEKYYLMKEEHRASYLLYLQNCLTKSR